MSEETMKAQHVTVAVEIVTLRAKSPSEAFRQAGEYLRIRPEVSAPFRVKTRQDKGQHELKLYFLRDCLNPKPTKENETALAVHLMEI